MTFEKGRHATNIDNRPDVIGILHDYVLTERHVVFYELPVVLDTQSIFLSTPSRTVGTILTEFAELEMIGHEQACPALFARPGSGLPYTWDPTGHPRVGLMRRGGPATDIRWCEANPDFAYQAMGAYDYDDGVVFEASCRARSSRPGTVEGPTMMGVWRMDPTTGEALAAPSDLPTEDNFRLRRRSDNAVDLLGYTFRTAPESAGSAPMRFGTSPSGDARDEFVFLQGSLGSVDAQIEMGYVYERSTDCTHLVREYGDALRAVATIDLRTGVLHGFHDNWAPLGR